MGHIEIRSVSDDDAEFLFQLMNEPTVMKDLNEVPTKKQDWEEAVSAWSEDADEEGYIVLSSGRPIGWFAVNGLLADDHTAFLKIAALMPAYQGKHIGRYVLQKCYGACGFSITEVLREQMSDGTIAGRYQMGRHF